LGGKCAEEGIEKGKMQRWLGSAGGKCPEKVKQEVWKKWKNENRKRAKKGVRRGIE
jgi:hypothetical protein